MCVWFIRRVPTARALAATFGTSGAGDGCIVRTPRPCCFSVHLIPASTATGPQGDHRARRQSRLIGPALRHRSDSPTINGGGLGFFYHPICKARNSQCILLLLLFVGRGLFVPFRHRGTKDRVTSLGTNKLSGSGECHHREDFFWTSELSSFVVPTLLLLLLQLLQLLVVVGTPPCSAARW